jgi:hypothetical protein
MLAAQPSPLPDRTGLWFLPSRQEGPSRVIELQTAAICAILLASAFLGAWVQTALPRHHRAHDTVETIRLVMTMLVTFSALVLGLLTSSAKARHDTQVGNLEKYAVDLIELDQRLRQYGPDARAIRAQLRTYTAAAIADTWPDEQLPSGAYPRRGELGTANGVESATLGDMLTGVDRMIEELQPTDMFHRQTAERLRARVVDNLQQRWRLIASTHPTISWPLLTVLILWLVIIFAIFGLSSPYNALVAVVVLLCALSISSALYLILEFDTPQAGLLPVPSQSLRDALAHMDRPEAPPPGIPPP